MPLLSRSSACTEARLFGEVVQVDRVSAVCENEPRAFLPVKRLGDLFGWPKPCFGQRGVSSKHAIFRHEDVGVTIAGKIQELGTSNQIAGWLAGDNFDWARAYGRSLTAVLTHLVLGTQVRLVELAVRLVGQNAGDAFLIQVYPLLGAPIQAYWEVLQAFCVHLPDRKLGQLRRIGELAISEFQWWQRFLEVPTAMSLVTGLG